MSKRKYSHDLNDTEDRQQARGASDVQNKLPVSDADLINEIDSLLHVYKLGIDGNVWSKLDSVFDHVQDVEYEIAPEVEAAVLAGEDYDLWEETTVDDGAQPVSDAPETLAEQPSFFAEVLDYLKQNKRTAIIAGAVLCAVVVFLAVIISNVKPHDAHVKLDSNTHTEQKDSGETSDAHQDEDLESRYQEAVTAMNAGNYKDAIPVLEALNSYKDSAEKLSECYYMTAAALTEPGDLLHALSNFSKAGNFKDAQERAAALRKLYQKSLQLRSISVGRYHTLALKEDGTVLTLGSNEHYQCNVSDWSDIVSVSVGEMHSAGLRADGKVMHAGAINYGQRNVTDWSNIVAISSDRYHTIGLKADGTVVAAGRGDYGQCDVQYWTDIVAISTGAYHTAALKTDGTVIAVGNNKHGQCDVSNWTDMIAVYASDNHTVGLKADGTVVAVGYNTYGQCDVADWDDIVDIGIGTAFTIGLKADGTLVSVGYPYGNLHSTEKWTDIIAIDVGASYITGLKADGTVVTVNFDYEDQLTIADWTDIKLPE